MPVQLYDKVGAPAAVDAEKAQAGVLDGSLAPKTEDLVHVVLKDGRKGTVAGHELASTLRAGARILDPEVEHHAELVKSQEGIGGAWDAANQGVFSGVTAGLGPGLIRKGISAISPDVGKKYGEYVEATREAHPYVSVGGEVVGAAGAAALSKGASAEAGIARFAPAAAIDAVGGAAEHAVGRAIAGVGGEGVGAMAGRAAVQSAARAGTEGALYAAGTHVGEDLLGDHETAADKLFVATAKGGAFGLGLGGVLGGAGSLVKSARSAARKGGGALLSEAATEATTSAETRLRAAEAAHADATKRSFSWQDMQGEPIKGDLYRAKPGGLDDFTTPVESEPAFDMQTRRSINLGPSEGFGEGGYTNPHSVGALDGSNFDKNGQLVKPKAPATEKAFDIGSMNRDVGVLGQDAGVHNVESPGDVFRISKADAQTSRASRRASLEEGLSGDAMRSYDEASGELSASAPKQTQGAGRVRFGEGFSEGEGLIGQKDSVFGVGPKKGAVSLKPGFDSLEPVEAGSGPFRISTDKGVIDANEKLRRGTLGEAHMPQTNADAGFSTASKGGEVEPFSVAPEFEDPVVTARKKLLAEELTAAQKDYAKATQDAEEALDLHKLAAEVKSGDPHGIAADFAWQSTGANKGLTNKVNKFPGGTRRAGATAIRLGVVDVGGDKGAIEATFGSLSENTPEHMLSRAQKKLTELTAQLEGIGGTKAHATLGELLAPLDAEIAKLEKVSTTVPVANRLRAQRQMLLGTPKFRALLDVDGNLVAGAEKAPVSLSDIIAERREAGRTAYAVGDVNANQIKQSNAALYESWSTLEGQALDRVGGSGAGFKAIKTDVTDLINIEKALEGRIAGMSSGRSVGLLDHLVGHGAAMAGGAVLPVGGHIIGGAIGAMLSKTMRERGSAAAAVAMTKIADIGAVRHLMGTVDSAVERAAKGLTTASETKAASGPRLRIVGGSASSEKREPIGARYRAAIAKLDALESQGTPVHERALASTQDLAQHAPNVAGAFATNVARAASFLSSKRPQPLLANNPYMNQEPSVLDTDKLAFLRSWDAATNPMEVLARFERGVITPEDTEALKATAPKVYEMLQEKTMAEVANARAAGRPMPFKKRMALGMLFDIATDPALEPGNYKMLQGNVFTPPAPAQPPSGGGKSNAPRRPVKLPGLGASPLDQLANKGPGRK